MKYSLITVINGNFKVEAEFGSNLKGAIVSFHQKCASLWNVSEEEMPLTAVVQIVDDRLNVVNGYNETIILPIVPPAE